VILPVAIALALALMALFLPLGAPDDPQADLSANGHVALRLTILIGAVVTAALMGLMFHSHDSGVDDAVDAGLTEGENRPIQPWGEAETKPGPEAQSDGPGENR
jgi:hypothetical protein